MWLSKRIKHDIDSSKIISLDVFDTLLSRRFMHPYDVFGFIEQVCQCPGFKDARIVAEYNARQKYKKDVNLDEIYNVISVQYAHLKSFELATEMNCMYANPIGYEILQYAKKAGKDVICTSDTYFSKDFIIGALAKNGIINLPVNTDNIFVSNEHNARKSDGLLFDCVINTTGVLPRDIVHFGDSQHSDYVMPRKRGMRAHKIPYVIKEFSAATENKKFVNLYAELNNNPLTSLFVGMYAKQWWCSKHTGRKLDFWYSVGYAIIAPFIYGYTQFIRQNLPTETPCDLLFVARDGFLLKKCFDAFNSNCDINTHYVYAPRLVKILGDLDYSNKSEYLDIIINYYSNINGTFKRAFENKTIDFREKQQLFIDKQNLIAPQAMELKSRYIEYAKTIKLHSDNVMMVDLASSVMSSQRILNDVLPQPIKYGFYLGTNGDLPHRAYMDRHENQTLDMGPIYELLVSSPEFPIKDFSDKRPVYNEDNLLEKHDKQLFIKSMDGVLDYIQDLKNSGLCGQFHTLPMKVFAKYQNNFWRLLSRVDLKQLQQANWAYDALNNNHANMYQYYRATVARKSEGAFKKSLYRFRGSFLKFIINLVPVKRWRHAMRRHCFSNRNV